MRRDTRGAGQASDDWERNFAVAALVGFLALFAGVRRGCTDASDQALTAWFQRWRAPWFDRASAVASWPGFPPQSRVVPALLVAVAWLGSGRRDGFFQLVTWVVAPLGVLAKARMRRPRPAASSVRVAQAALDGSSFPSGHVLTYVAVYGHFALTLLHSNFPAWLRRTCATLGGGLIALVGPSRVYLGHHWATDVVAAYLLGLAYLLGVRAFQRRLQARWAER